MSIFVAQVKNYFMGLALLKVGHKGSVLKPNLVGLSTLLDLGESLIFSTNGGMFPIHIRWRRRNADTLHNCSKKNMTGIGKKINI